MSGDGDEGNGAGGGRPGLRTLASARAQDIVGRLKSSVPALFPPPPPETMPDQLKLLLAMRTSRLRRFLIRALVFMALPTLLVLFYTGVIATPRYVSTFQVTYQVYQPTTSVGGGLVPVAISQTDAVDYGAVIAEYVQSETLADKLDQQLHLRDYYSNNKIDWTSRLSRNASGPAYYSYYGSHVSVAEGFGGYDTITVQAFDPVFAQTLANKVNEDANDMLDGITAQARTAEVNVANEQMAEALTQLSRANAALTDFRNKHGDLDPSQIAGELGAIEGTLESQLATTKAALAQAQANMQPDNSQIVQLQLQVKAIQGAIDSERARLAGDGTGNYSNTVADYQTMLSNQQLATTNYQAAQQALVAAQADAARKQNFVVDFVSPTLPDRPTAPNPWLSAGETLLACIVGYAIVNLLYSALRDQTGV